jgi:hypothetical protein
MRKKTMSANETGKGNRRFFALTSLGKNRWYWVVWPSLIELQTSANPISHIAEGVEETKADAVEKALDVAGRFAAWVAGKYALAYYQNTKAGTTPSGNRSRIPGSPGVPVLHEYLYRDIYDDSTKQWQSVPHRIVNRTSKYIYVEQRPFSRDDLTGSWLDGEQPVYRLDRQALEQQGYAFIPATAALPEHEEPVFFISERYIWQGNQVPTCLKVLHLSWPCTVTDVHEAYRKLVKSTHPDGGGSHDKFLELQAAYEQALRLIKNLS